MAGTAVLGLNLVDDLVPVVDELRGDLHPDMGVRQYHVTAVKRRWSGTCRGSGTASFVTQTEITPQPLVKDEEAQYGLHYKVDEFGKQEEGEISVSEVSLTYTETELSGGTLAKNEEFYYRLTDAHGQGIRTRYYMLARPPVTDREKTLGWELRLKRIEVKE